MKTMYMRCLTGSIMAASVIIIAIQGTRISDLNNRAQDLQSENRRFKQSISSNLQRTVRDTQTKQPENIARDKVSHAVIQGGDSAHEERFEEYAEPSSYSKEKKNFNLAMNDALNSVFTENEKQIVSEVIMKYGDLEDENFDSILASHLGPESVAKLKSYVEQTQTNAGYYTREQEILKFGASIGLRPDQLADARQILLQNEVITNVDSTFQENPSNEQQLARLNSQIEGLDYVREELGASIDGDQYERLNAWVDSRLDAVQKLQGYLIE